MLHLYTILRNWIWLTGWLILAVSSVSAEISVSYPIELSGRSAPATTAGDLEQALAEQGIAVGGILIENDRAVIRASIAGHDQVFAQLKPSGEWVSGYFYFKVSRTAPDGSIEAIRYYAQFPKTQEGRKFSEKLLFRLEPIYSAQTLKRVAPKLPEQFTAEITCRPYVEDPNIVSMITEIIPEDLPSISTVFCIFPDKLLEFGSASVEQNNWQLEAKWECRLFAHGKNLKQEALKQKGFPTLVAPGTIPDHVTRELKQLFDSAGVDFKSTPKSDVILDGEHVALSLPPAEMHKARAIMKHYNEVRQNVTTATYAHSKDEQETRVGARLTCWSGSKAVIEIPDLSLLGYESPEPSSIPTLHMSIETTTGDNDTTDIIVEMGGEDILGYNKIENSQELTLPNAYKTQICEHKKEENGTSQRWTLDLLVKRDNLGLPPLDPESIIIDFIPISRDTIFRLTNHSTSNEQRTVNPFLAPVATNPDRSVLAIKLASAFRSRGAPGIDKKATMVYDGEQLIIEAKRATIERIRQIVRKVSYQNLIKGIFKWDYPDKGGSKIKTETILASISKKSATFTTHMNESNHAASDGHTVTKFSFAPTIDRSNNEAGDFIAEAKLQHMEAGREQPWWLEIKKSNQGDSSKKSLPAGSEFSLKLEEFDVFDE